MQNVKIDLGRIFTGFTFDYGSQLPHEIKDAEEGPELVISYRNDLGAGTFVVRKATTADLKYDEVQAGMWVILVTHEYGCNFAPRAGSRDIEEIGRDLVTIATEVAGPSTGAESALVTENAGS